MTPETGCIARLPQASFIGNGAIGSLFAAICQRSNLPFDMWWRKYTKEALTVKLLDGSSKNLSTSTPHPTELLVIATKAWQVKQVIRQYKTWLLPNACVVLLHNGAGTEDWVLAELPLQSVMRMTTSKAALKKSQYLIEETGTGATQAGWLREPEPTQKSQLEQWCQLLLHDCQWFEDIRQPIWQKLAVNSVINPLTALHNIKNGGLLQPQFQDTITQLIEEFIAVCHAVNLDVQKQQIEQLIWTAIHQTADNYSSMHQDLTHHRPTEIDYINGFLLNRAKTAGINLPVNEVLVNKIKAIEVARR